MRERILNLAGEVVETEVVLNELKGEWRTVSGLALVDCGGFLRIKKEF